MKTERESVRCPLCGVKEITIEYYLARDGAFRATSDPCDYCGYFVDPLALSGSVETLRETVTAKPQTHVGQLAQWTTKGILYDGAIEMFLPPSYDCRGLGKHGYELTRGARKSKFPRYLLRTGDEFHAVLVKSVFVIPSKPKQPEKQTEIPAGE